MRCDKCRDLIYEYFDEAVPPARRKTIEEHLAQCPACGAAFEQERQFSKSLAGLFEQQTRGLRLAPQIRQNVTARLEGRNVTVLLGNVFRKPSLRPSLAAAACLALVCLSAFMLKHLRPAENYGETARLERCYADATALLQMRAGQAPECLTASRRDVFQALPCFQTP